MILSKTRHRLYHHLRNTIAHPHVMLYSLGPIPSLLVESPSLQPSISLLLAFHENLSFARLKVRCSTTMITSSLPQHKFAQRTGKRLTMPTLTLTSPFLPVRRLPHTVTKSWTRLSLRISM